MPAADRGRRGAGCAIPPDARPTLCEDPQPDARVAALSTPRDNSVPGARPFGWVWEARLDDRRSRFDRLVRPVLSDLLRFARRLARDPVAADDLLQQALLRGLDRLGQLEDDGAYRVWQSRIVYTTWLDQRPRRMEMTLDEGIGSATPLHREVARGPEQAAASRQLGRRIADALDGLPADQREAVWLVDGQGFKFSDAAAVLGISPGTAASRVARGRAALRVALASVAADEGVRS